ncbi:MAG TPA: glycoside hydrolase family 38 C-terminal domain-containing protein [Terracidiphilus sp.]|nr:glycoside hydrolase family 38 C-terminal domain-containing protein [Terracidiphilus sp.]
MARDEKDQQLMKQIRILAILVSFMGSAAWAQTTEQLHAAMNTLPEPAQQVIERLGQLNQLPAGEWRVHPGDLTHGESPDLDDSAWPVATAGSQYPSGAVWFRQHLEIPKDLHGYDLTDAKIWFAFQSRTTGRDAVNEIVYLAGRRVAMGEGLEKIELFDHAKPGDRIVIAVKLLASTGSKQFQGAMESIDFAPNRPNPMDMHDEFVSAAFLVPSLSKNASADEATLAKAIEQVDLKALDAGDQNQFDASLKQSESALEALKPLLQQATMHLTGNSHIDAAWLWPWTETVDVVKRTFGTALQLMNEYPDYTYTQSAAAYDDWIADKYPEMNDAIKKRIQEGRWEVVGGMWVEPDLNIPDGESTARSILIGKRWFQQHYGVDVKIGWNPDSFGYNWQLPQIYKKSGIDYFVTQKMSWNDTNQLPLKLFWWQSPDGSKVLTYFPRGYGNRILNPVRLSADLAQARTFAPGMTTMMDLYGVGDHGGGPTRDMLDQGTHWMQPGKIAPKMEFGTAYPYLSSVEKQIAPDSKTWNYKTIAEGYQYPSAPPEGEISIPTWNDELYLEYHRGVFTTQAAMKRNLREGPEWALNAEKYASLAWLDGDAYPGAELTDAWKKITFNGFHDLAAGSGIAVIYRDAQKDFDDVRWETSEISHKALNTLASRVDTKVATGVPVLVFNPLGWQRSGRVEVTVQMPGVTQDVSVLDVHGAVLPSETLSKDAKTNTFHLLVAARDIPSIGYAVLHVVPGKRAFASDLKVTGTTLENANLRVAVDPKTGCITSLFDKKTSFESLAAGSCGNELQAFKDTPTRYDAWNIDPGTLDQPPVNITQADSVQVVESGPMRGVVRVTRTWQSSKFVQDIVLYAGGDEAQVVNNIDWRETHILLKSAIALAATAPVATYEIPFGSIERPTTRNNSFEKARFEVPALRWADEGDGQHGVSLLNDSKFGYDAVGNLLRLSLLRSPTSPDPDADRGHQRFSYALYPHAGDWKQAMTVRHGFEFNIKLRAMQVEPHAGSLPAEHSFAAVSPEDVVMTAMKKAEDSDALIFHMYEWAGKSASVELTAPAGATGAVETNLLEQPEGSPLPVNGGHVTIPIRPYQILAVRVDYAKSSQ